VVDWLVGWFIDLLCDQVSYVLHKYDSERSEMPGGNYAKDLRVKGLRGGAFG
jgi:hypothetical protein